MMKYILYILSISFIRAEEDDILKILRESSKVKIQKYPDYKIYDPFRKAFHAIKKSKKIKVQVAPPTPILGAIINDTAFIEGEWKRVGDIVKGYKIVAIKDNLVVLKFGKRTIKLSVVSHKSNKIKIINKRIK